MSQVDISTRILTTQDYQHIYVDACDDRVWLSVNVRGGHTHVTLTKEQAKEMIEALNRVLEAV